MILHNSKNIVVFHHLLDSPKGAWRYTKVIKAARQVSQKREKLCWKSAGVLMDTLKPARGIKYPWKGSFTNKNLHGKSFTNKNCHLTNKHGDLPMDDTVIIQHIRDITSGFIKTIINLGNSPLLGKCFGKSSFIMFINGILAGHDSQFAIEHGLFIQMFYLLKMVIFHILMLVYQTVPSGNLT